jgi:hypothetical protein
MWISPGGTTTDGEERMIRTSDHAFVGKFFIEDDAETLVLPLVARNPALRAYLERRAEEGYAALIRLNAREAFVLWAPALTNGRGWVEKHSGMCETEHSAEEKLAALGSMTVTLRP